MSEAAAWKLIADASALPPGDPQRAELLGQAEQQVNDLEQQQAGGTQ